MPIPNYDPHFFDVIRAGVQSSADVVVPLLLDRLGPIAGPIDRVLDVGCGEGWWAERFARHRIDVRGLDAGTIVDGPLGDRRISHDLTELPWPDLGDFDLVLCLEVLEHLAPSSAVAVVDELTRRAPVVVFSAAIPGQGGAGHVNEQWPRYWAEIFEAQGYTVSGALRWEIWTDDRVENWYRQNLMVAAEIPEEFPEIFDTPLAEPLPLVHPVLFDHVSQLRGRR